MFDLITVIHEIRQRQVVCMQRLDPYNTITKEACAEVIQRSIEFSHKDNGKNKGVFSMKKFLLVLVLLLLAGNGILISSISNHKNITQVNTSVPKVSPIPITNLYADDGRVVSSVPLKDISAYGEGWMTTDQLYQRFVLVGREKEGDVGGLQCEEEVYFVEGVSKKLMTIFAKLRDSSKKNWFVVAFFNNKKYAKMSPYPITSKTWYNFGEVAEREPVYIYEHNHYNGYVSE